MILVVRSLETLCCISDIVCVGMLVSNGCSVNVGDGATEIVSTLNDTCPSDVESSVTGSCSW